MNEQHPLEITASQPGGSQRLLWTVENIQMSKPKESSVIGGITKIMVLRFYLKTWGHSCAELRHQANYPPV